MSKEMILTEEDDKGLPAGKKCPLCGAPYADHPKCEACGAGFGKGHIDFSPLNFRGKKLCAYCRLAWLRKERRSGGEVPFETLLRGVAG